VPDTAARKIVPLESLAAIAADLRREGAHIVMAHGCFDLLHYGHIQHLQNARKLGNCLIVTVTADQFVHKGQGRPRFNQHMRAMALAALDCVDYVAVNHAETAAEAIELVSPHTFVKGVEFKGIESEKESLRRCGGRMEYVSGETILSSTALLAGQPA